MSDLSSPWTNPPVSTSMGTAGDNIIAAGGDPLITDGMKESANSVSGLEPIPARWAPSDYPPDPPSLQDRHPGTIDKQ